MTSAQEQDTARDTGSRWLGVGLLLALAPLTAELLAAYLGDLGGVFGLLFLIAFMAPLYGGAALLIREVAVRRGLGWPGRLLLAAAFGVAMPTIIDISLFTPTRDDIDYWSDIMAAATLGGLSMYAVVTWVGGHVVMSVFAPTVVAETLGRRPGPWLGWVGLVVTTIAMLLIALAIHQDTDGKTVTASGLDYAISAAVVLGLIGLALTPLGRPLTKVAGRRAAPVWACAVGGFVAMVCFDLSPMSWPGVVFAVAVIVVAGGLIGRLARSPLWSQAQMAALAFGALLARTCIGMLSPLPVNTTWAEKITQHVIYLTVVLLLGWLMARAVRRDAAPRLAP